MIKKIKKYWSCKKGKFGLLPNSISSKDIEPKSLKKLTIKAILSYIFKTKIYNTISIKTIKEKVVNRLNNAINYILRTGGENNIMKWKIKRKKGAYLQVNFGQARIKFERKDGKVEFSFVNGSIPFWQKIQLTVMLINAFVVVTKLFISIISSII